MNETAKNGDEIETKLTNRNDWESVEVHLSFIITLIVFTVKLQLITKAKLPSAMAIIDPTQLAYSMTNKAQ